MMRQVLSSLSFLTVFGLIVPQSVTALTCPQETRPVFILAGQSNMVGSKSTMTTLLPSDRRVQENVLWYNEENQWEALQPPTEPLPFTLYKQEGGFGPEITLGQTIARRLQQPVAIVKYAVEGSTLAEDWNPENPDSLYYAMRDRAYQAIGQLSLQTPQPVQIAGFFWMQGESDAKDEDMAQQYEANLSTLITQLRQDFHTPDLPIIIGQIFLRENHQSYHPPKTFPWGDQIRQSQTQVHETTPNTGLVETLDLPRDEDNLHFNNPGLMELGHRLAESWLTLTCPALTRHGTF
ncbi:sialate O-acetylesterase [Spirulina sp. CS-785/01]|uniref:sialate O-acetylesterase n=1 Tax=Spirulina sp. CS-785/01 TaxID=3021716 RepID=UPI00232EE739|nr:sialate O-acetylesterase [Spirulina sp. CS-785/01]MDB9314586.1 sialate O-acetylesterase [Spirulina sp. CS-785/01]